MALLTPPSINVTWTPCTEDAECKNLPYKDEFYRFDVICFMKFDPL